MMNCDVLIIGGGLVGSSLAAALGSHPLGKSLQVVLVDPKPPTLDSLPKTSIRTSTITPSSQLFLDDIGVWSLLPTSRIATFADMFIWDHPKPLPTSPSSIPPAGTLYFNAKDINEQSLGYVIDNDTLRHAIFTRLQHHMNINSQNLNVVTGSVNSIDFGDQDNSTDSSTSHHQTFAGGDQRSPWPIVHLDNGQTIRSRLLVACDGSRSRVRTLASADWFTQGYKQSAVVANVTLKDPINTAYQRFVSTGPVAVLPVATDETVAPVGNIIWTTTPAEAAALHAADTPVFLDELNVVLSAHEDENIDTSINDPPLSTIDMHPQTADRSDVPLWNIMAKGLQIALPNIGTINDTRQMNVHPPQATSQLGRRGHFPLTIGHAPRYVIHEKRTVLVGDAAHSVHPLAGQGVNLGFADARHLAECLAAAAGTGRDIGGEMGAPLMRYQGERMMANMSMMGVLHGLQRVFDKNQFQTFRALRRTGISMLNTASPMKRMILRAMR